MERTQGPRVPSASAYPAQTWPQAHIWDFWSPGLWLRLRGHAGLLNQDRAPPTLAIFKMSRQSLGCLGCPPCGPYRHVSPPGRRPIAWQPWVAHPTGRGRSDACAGRHTAGTQLMLIELANDRSLADSLEGTRLCPRGLGPRLLHWKQESLWTHSPSRPCGGEGGRDTQLGGEAGNISPLCGGLTTAGTTGQGLRNRRGVGGEEGVEPHPGVHGTAPGHDDSPDDSGVGSGPGVPFTFPAHHQIPGQPGIYS